MRWAPTPGSSSIPGGPGCAGHRLPALSPSLEARAAVGTVPPAFPPFQERPKPSLSPEDAGKGERPPSRPGMQPAPPAPVRGSAALLRPRAACGVCFLSSLASSRVFIGMEPNIAMDAQERSGVTGFPPPEGKGQPDGGSANTKHLPQPAAPSSSPLPQNFPK